MSHHRSSREGNGNRSSYNNNRDKAIESVALAYLIHLRDDLDASANDVVLTANLVRSLSLSHSLSLSLSLTFFEFYYILTYVLKMARVIHILSVPRSTVVVARSSVSRDVVEEFEKKIRFFFFTNFNLILSLLSLYCVLHVCWLIGCVVFPLCCSRGLRSPRCSSHTLHRRRRKKIKELVSYHTSLSLSLFLSTPNNSPVEKINK